jgi:autoinducer 2-degrading protein
MPRMSEWLVIVHVYAQVKPDAVEALIAATRENARHSLKEPGVARFDVVQSVEDPTPSWLPHSSVGIARDQAALR